MRGAESEEGEEKRIIRVKRRKGRGANSEGKEKKGKAKSGGAVEGRVDAKA